MLTSISGGVQDLTQEEQILHHYAAMIKKDLDRYHAYSVSQEGWRDLFKNRLARIIPVIHFYKPFSDLSRQNRLTFMPMPVTGIQILPFAFIHYY
jgi:hypothetical protein